MEEEKKSSKLPIVLLGLALILFLIFFTTGFFVIQPIGAVPEGVTIWYIRAGLNLGFIESADGLLLKESGEVSLFGRAAMIGKVVELIDDKTIVKLPYSNTMYRISTGGVEFEQ